MSTIVASIEAEYRRYRALGEETIAQLDDDALSTPGPGGGHSIAILVWHVSGNLASRFTDFLTSDGEKPWRQRDEEFTARAVSRADLLQKWQHGWSILFDTLGRLGDDQLQQSVTIRGERLSVHEALHRSLAHTSYHVGQMVYLAKSVLGARWRYLSIPPGQSAAYNKNPTRDRPESTARSSASAGNDESG